jgi:DNA-binding SARP family transcriptional activator
MAADEIGYAVLGPLEARVGGSSVALGGRLQRAVLSALLLRANEPVSPDRLVQAVWGERPPATATHAIHVYVSRLRKALGAEAIGHTGAGYVLRVAPGRLDLERFETLVAAGRQELLSGEPARACELLDDALALWRGPALAGLQLEDFAQTSVSRLDELRLAAATTRLEAKLTLGLHCEVIAELEELTAEHPHDERLCGLLMVALYRAGRQGDALACYQAARRTLSEDLGIEPSESLRDLEAKILAHDGSLRLEPDRAGDTVRSVVVLPRRLGQLEELAELTEPFARSRNPHEVIFAWIEQPGPASAVSAALASANRALARLRDDLVARGGRVRVAAFTAADVAEDTLRFARRTEVDLLVLGRDLSDMDDGSFDSDLGRILGTAPCDVALWLKTQDTGCRSEEAIVVPFGALEHDWAALELGAWIAGTTGRPLVLLGTGGDSHGERRDASRLLADAGLLIQHATGVVAQPRLSEPGRAGLLDGVADAGLVLAGLSERWSTEGLGTTRLELARSANAPVLFLRRGLRPGGISPPDKITLYRWSVTVAA